jgi:uridine phosphorylase
MHLPLTEADLDAPGIIEPAQVWDPIDIPRRAVLCFFSEMVDQIAARADARQVDVRVWAHGRHPVYEFEHHGDRLAVMQPGVGAPLGVGLLEELIALGCRAFVAVGGAGALLPELVLGHAVVVDSALRDEGTSFHYLAPSRTVDADPDGVAALQATLRAADVPFLTGRTWTTDAPYRETRSRLERRVGEGCMTVEMEASAFLAVARYRNVRFAQVLYAGDSLAGPTWDERGWATATSIREQLFWHAADACLRLELPGTGA